MVTFTLPSLRSFVLFRKKIKYYVQSEEEMRLQLLEKGLVGSVFEPGDNQQIEEEQLTSLCQVLAVIEEAILTLERRGISLKLHAQRQDPETGELPIFHVFLGSQEHWFANRKSF